jgi:novobiocin biosynthesis protein NovU/D-mycarose 3-C-methyltransferase
VKRTACSACGHTDLDQFLDLGLSPIADAYTVTPDEDSPKFPLQVAVCAKCRLVQLLEVVPADVLFGTGYSFYSSASAPLSAYHAAYAADVRDRYPGLATRGVVEVGCNDGDLLRHFRAFPHVGVDPSSGPAAVAAERGCEVLVEPFGLATAQLIRSERGPQGLVFANHVLAHVEDVSDVLAGIAHLLRDNGIAMVEVQYLPDMLVNNAFDLVYHEHRNFFSLSSLESAAATHGLRVHDVELTDRQGGSLRVALSRQLSPTSRVFKVRMSEQWLNDFSAYAGMQGRAERIRTRLQDLVIGDVAAYGAPAKLTTLVAFCGFDVEHLHWCVDTTPAKQGRFIPGTHIEIYPPGEPDVPRDGFLLAAHNYAAPIMAANPGNRWILPIPAPVLI